MDYTRTSGLFNARDWSATLIGAGGIGAITAITLAKMGLDSLTIFDDDRVSEVNIPTQFFRTFDIERYKAYALTDMLLTFSDEIQISSETSRVNEYTPADFIANPIIISAVDSITARQEIWKVVRQNKFMWYIDARMAVETFMAYLVNQDRLDWYDTILASQNEADVPDEPCTAKATIYTANIAAGHIGSFVRSIISYEPLPKILVHDIRNRILTTI